METGRAVSSFVSTMLTVKMSQCKRKSSPMIRLFDAIKSSFEINLFKNDKNIMPLRKQVFFFLKSWQLESSVSLEAWQEKQANLLTTLIGSATIQAYCRFTLTSPTMIVLIGSLKRTRSISYWAGYVNNCTLQVL